MPMRLSFHESWPNYEGNQVTRKGCGIAADRSRRHRRYSIPSAPITTTTTTKVHIVLPPTPEPQPQVHEVCYVPAYIPTPPSPEPIYDSIRIDAETIATRIVAENTARDEITTLQVRLEEEQSLRLKAEHDRGREEARRITQEIDTNRRSRELFLREDDARRRIADEYRHHTRSLGNSPRTSGDDLWSTSAVASSSHNDRLVVVDRHHSHHRSHSDSRNHRCSNCGHSGHRSRECRYNPDSSGYRVAGRVRIIDSGL